MHAPRLAANARVWVAIGLMAIVALFGAAPAALADAPSGHHDHHVTATGEFDHLAAVDHDHIDAAAPGGAPELLADAPLSRIRVALPALGLFFALAVLWLLSPQGTPFVGRDPPRRPVFVSTGRALLTRLCIARR